jgi:hypothetical protein
MIGFGGCHSIQLTYERVGAILLGRPSIVQSFIAYPGCKSVYSLCPCSLKLSKNVEMSVCAAGAG